MRIGPIKIKLKPLLLIIPLYCLPISLYNWYEYRQFNLTFQKREEQVVLSAAAKASKISDKSFPTVFFDPNGKHFLDLEDLQGQIRVLIFSDQQTFKRISRSLQRTLQSFQINYYNIIQEAQIEKLTNDVLTIEQQVENQIIVIYQENVIYADKIIEKIDSQTKIIEKQLGKALEKEFLSKIKF